MVEVVFAGDEHGNLPWATSRIQSVGASGVTGRQGNHGVSLLLSSREKKALNRNYFNTLLWRPALERSGIPDERENGSHAIRHFFASTALHEGETIKAVSEYLGHADPGFTLRTYTPDGGQLGVDEASDRHGVSAPLALLRQPQAPAEEPDDHGRQRLFSELGTNVVEECGSRVSFASVTFPIHSRDMTTLSPAAVIRETPEKSFVHVDRLPGSSTAARKAASRAAKDGLLLPVRRGLYYRGRRTRYGVTAPRADEIARAVLGARGIGPAGYSAARAWGVTTQIPPVWHVATLRTVDPIDGVIQHERKNLARADLNEKEISLLELLRAPEVYVEAGWDVLAMKVGAALRSGEIRSERLRETVPGEYNRAVRDNFARLDLDSEQVAPSYDLPMAIATPQTPGPLSGPTGRRVAMHRDEMLDVLRRHRVTNPQIFGSSARGDDHEGSDLDLLVDFGADTDLIDMVNIKLELEAILGVPVDLIPRDGLKDRVRLSAERDLVPL